MKNKTKSPTNDDVINIYNEIIKLNDWNGNQGAINYLEQFFCGWIQSNVSEETHGNQREAMTIFFFDLLNVLRMSKGLDKVEKNEISILTTTNNNTPKPPDAGK
ncbi:MAG: hypothetical protein JNJ41_00550 [Bacteroidia bacterium]|nr:hypothetical protein [Bacteroidia bacterium]